MTADGGRAAIYGMHHAGGFYTEGLIGGGYSSYDIKRAGLQGSAFSSPDGGELDAYLGSGYDFKVGQSTLITPMASVLYSLVGVGSFSETGSLEPLAYPDQNESSLRTRFGLRAATTFKVRQALVTPSVSAQWQHEFLDKELGFDSYFANGAGTAFNVVGPAIGRDGALLTGAVNVTWSRYAAYVAYQADLGRHDFENQTVLAGFRVSW
jgi:outer membrane autotransporter protein